MEEQQDTSRMRASEHGFSLVETLIANVVLIVAGTLVGASGTLLTRMMICSLS